MGRTGVTDTIFMVDWSARSAPSPARPVKDAIFVAEHGPEAQAVSYHRTRGAALAHLVARFDAVLARGGRVIAGFDFPFGYPAGFAAALTGAADPFAVWRWLAEAIADDGRNANNRWDVAEAMNGRFPGVGPFWGCPAARASAALPARGTLRHGHGMAERRGVEMLLPRAQPCWKLFTTGSVGSQSLLGLPRLQSLRERYGARLTVRPFEEREADIVLAEVYPSLIDGAVRARALPGEIHDAAQVRVLAQAFAGLGPGRLDAMLREGDRKEGWIAGLGHEAELIAALEG
ncbi:molybdopterin guanine dinucleotide synthesis [Roseicyclus marinus]|uniref:molybdopterin guanine dinucleotide synthesis n=1 Tax=Roseicyclus marinus TaxID=2161673 RepID=UPI00240F7C44|nr:molybdopterin guanine dinucleotide synthesis [Roseicyclus marinus]MDG3042592.1 molybdopterin guanine dinucleotide synthesis [Roseicyclus marinus]